MKNRLLLLALVLLCAVTCAFGLASCGTQVTEVTNVTISRNILNMRVGDTEQLSATVEPADASNKTLVWESDNPSVATVDDNGLVTAKQDGYAVIRAYAQDRKHWDVCNVYVDGRQSGPQVEVEGVSIHTGFSHTSTVDLPINVMLSVGEEDTLFGQIFFTQTGDVPVEWTSEPQGIVEVTAIGSYEPNSGNPDIQASIKALKTGDATVTVSVGGKSASCKVRVIAEKYLKQLEFSYSNEDKNFTVCGLSDSNTEESIDLVIPSEMFGLPVVGIQGEAFREANNIKSVTIQSGVEYIGPYAFANCASLENVSLGEGLKTINYNAFSDCEKLETINIPNSIEEVGYSVFSGCAALTFDSLKCSTKILNFIPNSMIRELTVTGGDELDVRNFNSLQKLTFGGEVKSISDPYALSREVEIHYNGTLADWCETEGLDSLFVDNTNENSVIAWIEELTDSELVIPNGVTKIVDRAFARLDNITALTLPASVTSVGMGVVNYEAYCNLVINYLGDVKGWCELEGANHLIYNYDTCITELGGQINIGGSPLSGEIAIPAGTTRIGAMALALESVTAVSIPDTVKTIGKDAFYNSNITELCIPDGVESVAELRELRILTLRLPATLTEKVVVSVCNELQSIQFADGFDYDKIEVSDCSYKGDERNGGYYLGNKLNAIVDDVYLLVIPQDCSAITDGVFATDAASQLKYLFVESEDSTLLKNVSFNCLDLTVIGRNLPREMSGIKQHYSSSDLSCTADGWVYYIDRQYDQSRLVAYFGEGGEISVPSVLGGKAVAWCMVGELQPFLHRDDITKITFTSSKITVDSDAVFSLPNLTEIALADTVNEFVINIPRFTDCENLQGISIEGGYSNYRISMKANPTAEAVIVTPIDAANTLSHIKNTTYRLFTISKTAD